MRGPDFKKFFTRKAKPLAAPSSKGSQGQGKVAEPEMEQSAREIAKEEKPAISSQAPRHTFVRALSRPHVTEKAAALAQQNRYVFRVFPDATKNQIKQAVEQSYQVDVEKVWVMDVPAKKVRLGRKREGVRQGYKKAIVKVKKGQKIEVLSK